MSFCAAAGCADLADETHPIIQGGNAAIILCTKHAREWGYEAVDNARTEAVQVRSGAPRRAQRNRG